jgi:hypothetical protein
VNFTAAVLTVNVTAAVLAATRLNHDYYVHLQVLDMPGRPMAPPQAAHDDNLVIQTVTQTPQQYPGTTMTIHCCACFEAVRYMTTCNPNNACYIAARQPLLPRG